MMTASAPPSGTPAAAKSSKAPGTVRTSRPSRDAGGSLASPASNAARMPALGSTAASAATSKRGYAGRGGESSRREKMPVPEPASRIVNGCAGSCVRRNCSAVAGYDGRARSYWRQSGWTRSRRDAGLWDPESGQLDGCGVRGRSHGHLGACAWRRRHDRAGTTALTSSFVPSAKPAAATSCTAMVLWRVRSGAAARTRVARSMMRNVPGSESARDVRCRGGGGAGRDAGDARAHGCGAPMPTEPRAVGCRGSASAPRAPQCFSACSACSACSVCIPTSAAAPSLRQP